MEGSSVLIFSVRNLVSSGLLGALEEVSVFEGYGSMSRTGVAGSDVMGLLMRLLRDRAPPR